jgi:protein-disulfide isomerase
VSTTTGDNPAVSEIAVTPIPRRGRLWVVLALGLALAALGYSVVEISTQEAGRESIRIDGIASAQRLFGGIPQEGDRLGSDDAPVAIQVFADLQCGNCRADFLGTIPQLVEGYVRPGEAKLLLRHYSIAANALELGFYAAEAAAEQGYGWQYTYLFFVNQDEAERFGIDDRLMASLAGSIGELDVPEWQRYLEGQENADGAVTRRLEGYEDLGRSLGIRTRQAMIVSGPRGTRTLQDGPTLAQVERAIAAVSLP